MYNNTFQSNNNIKSQQQCCPQIKISSNQVRTLCHVLLTVVFRGKVSPLNEYMG